jgi:ComF family protein
MPLPVAGPAEANCRLCPELRPAIRAIRSAFVLDGPMRPLVHSLKYRGWYSAAQVMGVRMAELAWPREVEDEVRLVIPVPLAPTRLRQRGYNQAALLAAAFAAAKGWNHRPFMLERGRSAGSQTTLHPAERRANVAGAFRVPSRVIAELASEHVLVVDDVWTTGATTLSCAEALLGAGARAVSVLTFARALPELERLERRAALADLQV